jgi:hypothetical protein
MAKLNDPRIVGATLLVLSMAVGLFGWFTPNDVWSTPLRQPYRGETVSHLPVRIDLDGFYNVGLEVIKKVPGGSPPSIASPALAVQVIRSGVQVAEPSKGAAYGDFTVEFYDARFPANRDDLIYLSVRPGKGQRDLRGYEEHLLVTRDITDYWRFVYRQMRCLTAALILFLLGCYVLVRSGRRPHA